MEQPSTINDILHSIGKYVTEHSEALAKYFSDSKLVQAVKKYAKRIGYEATYGILLLYYVAASPNTPAKDKAIVFSALGYFILPLDLISDFMPVIGFADDIAAISWAVSTVWVNITPEIKEKARAKMHEWFSDFNEQESSAK